MPLASVELKELTDKAENIYEAVVIMSKRARQINEELKIRLNQELEMFTQHVEGEEDEVNPEQMKISIEYEMMPKPTQQAIEEMLAGKLRYRYKEEEE